MTKLLLGADPELFMQDVNGFFKSVFGILPGTKEAPHKVSRGAVQVDGMAAEFNIDPAATSEEFVLNLTTVMNTMQGMLPYGLVATPVAEFGAEYMATRDEKETELGCDPDYNCWTGDVNTPPDAAKTFRTGAGHVHIGWTENQDILDEKHIQACRTVVKQLDFYLGLASLFYDKDTKRRELYGKAGAFRVKPYGVEYRVLSNKWLENEALMTWVFNTTIKAIDDMRSGKRLADKYGDIQEIINASDIDAAKFIIEQEGLEVPNV